MDKKGRVSVPSAFRAALGDQLHHGVVLFSSHQHNCLEGLILPRWKSWFAHGSL